MNSRNVTCSRTGIAKIRPIWIDHAITVPPWFSIPENARNVPRRRPPSRRDAALRPDGDSDRLDVAVAGLAERPRHGLSPAFLVHRPAAEGIAARGKAGQQGRPVGLAEPQRPGAGPAGGVEADRVGSDRTAGDVAAPARR